jgi:hypothetical protein
VTAIMTKKTNTWLKLAIVGAAALAVRIVKAKLGWSLGALAKQYSADFPALAFDSTLEAYRAFFRRRGHRLAAFRCLPGNCGRQRGSRERFGIPILARDSRPAGERRCAAGAGDDPRIGPILTGAAPGIMTAGLAVEAVGLFLAIRARRHLGRNWSGEITIKEDHQLIRTGPYGVLRHPIYAGLLAMYAGTALVTGERLALIGLAMAAFAYWRKIQLEEANLNVAFGADYQAYRRETWALVPGLF